ncbi:MAG: ABC transporter ATP-binding protein [Candidatus Woesearchaeota archaeon]|nr:ABC transporter ATP-binding protein [Candidatus Woesearchaeota archaeon]
MEENLWYFGGIYGLSKPYLKRKIKELLSFVGLEEAGKKLAIKLSGGMSRRLDLAISLLNNPKLLILDELTAGLDPVSRKDILHKMAHLNKNDTTILISSHLLDEVELFCDKVLIIKEGSLLAKGSVKEIRDQFFGTEQVSILTYPGNYEKIIQHFGKQRHQITHYQIYDQKLILFAQRAAPVMDTILRILNNCNEELVEIDIQKPDLDEIFRQVSKQ